MKVEGAEYIDLTTSIDAPIVLKSGQNRFEWNAVSEGTYQLSSTKDISTYCITIWKNNGHLTLANGTGRVIMKWNSLFTGSFNLIGHAANGLYARCGGVNGKMTPLCVNWVEHG